jgi:hypothetical protein
MILNENNLRKNPLYLPFLEVKNNHFYWHLTLSVLFPPNSQLTPNSSGLYRYPEHIACVSAVFQDNYGVIRSRKSSCRFEYISPFSVKRYGPSAVYAHGTCHTINTGQKMARYCIMRGISDKVHSAGREIKGTYLVV